jgi:tetratricopeptide (TPR) repeat protein
MTSPELYAGLQARFDRLLAEMEVVEGQGETAAREGLRAEIIALFRETEGLAAELNTFKDRIRTLVARFKALPAAIVPPTRMDHLGSSTFLERGWNAIASGDYEQAVEALRRAVELAPGESAGEVLLGWALMLRGDLDDALVLLQEVLAREPSNLLARTNLGYICVKRELFSEAIEHLSMVLQSHGDRKALLYANFYMGLLYLEREMYGDARSFFARTTELGPNLIEAWWELGRVCYLDGKREEAVLAWRRGAAENRFSPWSDRCREALLRLDAEQGTPPS